MRADRRVQRLAYATAVVGLALCAHSLRNSRRVVMLRCGLPSSGELLMTAGCFRDGTTRS